MVLNRVLNARRVLDLKRVLNSRRIFVITSLKKMFVESSRKLDNFS